MAPTLKVDPFVIRLMSNTTPPVVRKMVLDPATIASNAELFEQLAWESVYGTKTAQPSSLAFATFEGVFVCPVEADVSVCGGCVCERMMRSRS